MPNPTVSESEPRSERYWRYSRSSCSVSPLELDEEALIAARWTFAPLEAQEAWGPPGGPDKKVSYATCQISSSRHSDGLTSIGRCLVVVEGGETVLRVSEPTTEGLGLTSWTLIPAQCLYPNAISAGRYPCNAANV